MGNSISGSVGESRRSERLVWLELFEEDPHNIPPARNSQASCVHEGSLYIFGGVGEAIVAKEIILFFVSTFSPLFLAFPRWSHE